MSFPRTDCAMRAWMIDRCAWETDSPIESLMVCALDYVLNTSRTHGGRPRIETQWLQLSYRVDIALLGTSYTGVPFRIGIECDGAEFHDPDRDKPRDRNLLLQGVQMLRFTGREITRNPFACAEQALALYNRLALEHSEAKAA